MSDVLDAIAAIVAERRDADPEISYVASLNVKGIDKILEKVGEEATEVILAARDAAENGDSGPLVEEVADLWFHTLVMLSHLNLDHTAVIKVLDTRLGLSGLAEKAARKGHNAAPTNG